MKRIPALSLALLMAALPGPAAGATVEVPRHEVWLGMGSARSSEAHVFNTADDVPSNPESALGFGYWCNLDPHLAVGLNVYGTTEVSPEVSVVDAAGQPVATTFDLNTYNYGARVRWTFFRGSFAPYAYVGLNVADGIAESDAIAPLEYRGRSACYGFGATVAFARSFRLAVETVTSSGTARWSQPLAGSTSATIDPSFTGALVHVGFAWGETVR